MVFYHVRTIIVPIGICAPPFICAGVYNLINRVIAHFLSIYLVCICMRACLHAGRSPSGSDIGADFGPSACRPASGVSVLFMKQAY